MEVNEQTSYNVGATENCKDLITKANRFLEELPTEKVLKMLRGIDVGFVDVFHEEKRITEDWEDTKIIYIETFYEMLNKYLFDKLDAQNTHYVNHTAFVTETMRHPEADSSEIIPFIIRNFLLKGKVSSPSNASQKSGETQADSNEESFAYSNEKIIKVTVDDDGDSIVTYDSGRKAIIPKSKQGSLSIASNPTPAHELAQVESTGEQVPPVGSVHNHEPIPMLHGNESLVAAHEASTVQYSNFQNPVDMLKRTAEQVAPTVNAIPTEALPLSSGAHFLGVTATPHENENVNEVLASLSEIAEFLLDLEQEDEPKNNAMLKNLHSHAKMSLLTASMSIVRVITHKR
jgi:hypothetical protein